MTAGGRTAAGATRARAGRPLRLGFLGVGWIGRQRMESLLATGRAHAAVIADPDCELRLAAATAAAAATSAAAEAAMARERGPVPADPVQVAGLDELLEQELDGVVIATPSALHAEQAIAALDAGLPVFCQKPLARDAAEADAVVAAAASADRLLAVDLSYRFTSGARAMQAQLQAGAIGDVYALDLVFHNAYGPDKPWFTRRDLAGGGCVVDLGTHLIDLALWLTQSPGARVVSGHLLRSGHPLGRDGVAVEDHALAELELAGGAVARLACSWWLPAGRDCVLEVVLYGTDGALALRNVGGSFYDFECRLQHRTKSQLLTGPPDDWGGRALEAWASRLRVSNGFDAAAEQLVAVARVIDEIYEAGVAR